MILPEIKTPKGETYEQLPRFEGAAVKKATKAKVVAVREFPPAFAKFGDGIFVVLSVNSKKQEWVVRFKGQSGRPTKAFSGLVETLGRNTDKWIGKSITLSPVKVKGLTPFVEVSK